MADPTKPVYAVAVRALVEFARGGDLEGGGQFMGSQRALEGSRGHRRIQRSRPEGYQKEVSVACVLDIGECELRIQGRVDGLFEGSDPLTVEEIKTVQGAWDGAADPQHWAQAKVYGYILAAERGLEAVRLQLTYLQLETEEVTEFSELHERAALRGFFERLTGLYAEWILDRHSWIRRRNRSIHALPFPFSSYRPGQRSLAVAAYRALARGSRLFAEAPTGIGKTLSVVFPAFKALGEGHLDQIFFLTAKTVGANAAEQALGELRGRGLEARSLALTARDKICPRPGAGCDPRTCELARGYYDRRLGAMRDALGAGQITRAELERVGEAHQICPFELGLDLTPWVDLIVCDYNYVFDPKVSLKRHFADTERACAFLIDEAHNLVDRAREMFSAELDARELREVRRQVGDAAPRCGRALSRAATALSKWWRELNPEAAPAATSAPSVPELFDAAAETSAESPAEADAESPEGEKQKAAHALPEPVLEALGRALREAELWLVQNRPGEFREALMEAYFQMHGFLRVAECYDERYVTLANPDEKGRVRLFCLDPSMLLGQALERGKSAVFFSATLTPMEYFRSLLGGRAEDPELRLDSPFPPEHLEVLVQPRIRTHYKDREQTLSEVVSAIASVATARQGHYLVYFPSYQYLDKALEGFRQACPEMPVMAQRPGMTEEQRAEFLRAFSGSVDDPLVGFAVMGGIFGEGIDLVGEKLIGVVVVGVGLPQICPEREVIRNYYESRLNAGFDYAYTFPGMNRVLQAAGRVIRSEADRGVVLLIDSRFGQARYRSLYPAWWRTRFIRDNREISESLKGFWVSEKPGS